MRIALPAAIFLIALPLAAQVEISGDVTAPFTLKDLAGFTPETVTVAEKGQSAQFPGVLLAEVLKKAGTQFDTSMSNRELHTKAMTTFVLVTAADGYRTVFSLAELDPHNSAANVMLILKPDSSFSLSVPLDKTRARNVRMVRKITVNIVPATQ